MLNDEVDDAPRPANPEVATAIEPSPAPASPTLPLLILASDDDAVCVDDLCLPADARA